MGGVAYLWSQDHRLCFLQIPLASLSENLQLSWWWFAAKCEMAGMKSLRLWLLKLWRAHSWFGNHLGSQVEKFKYLCSYSWVGESGATDWWMNWSDGDAAPVCGKERSKHEGRQIYWSIYIPVLWPRAVGSDSSFLLIADTINRNEVPQKGVWVRSLSSTCWGVSGFWPGCLLDAS